MEIKINSKTVVVNDGATISQVLLSNNIDAKGIAVAVNENVVPKPQYDTYSLNQGDDIIIIKAFYGG